MTFALIYLVGMLISLASFLYLNMHYKWVTKAMYYNSYDGGVIILTIGCILFYPIAIIVELFMMVWYKYIPD